ncbi:MAG: zinc ribbon domain-containing protein [Bryobacteraceae bacterium]|nr:zinc ribbon domain-containing protein [Bryobacteraceae bacterium]
MPMYEYRCGECGHPFETLRRFSESDTEVQCPKCGARRAERQLSCFSMSGCGGGGNGRFT